MPNLSNPLSEHLTYLATIKRQSYTTNAIGEHVPDGSPTTIGTTPCLYYNTAGTFRQIEYGTRDFATYEMITPPGVNIQSGDLVEIDTLNFKVVAPPVKYVVGLKVIMELV